MLMGWNVGSMSPRTLKSFSTPSLRSFTRSCIVQLKKRYRTFDNIQILQSGQIGGRRYFLVSQSFTTELLLHMWIGGVVHLGTISSLFLETSMRVGWN